MLPPYLRLKVRATDAKLWDQKGAIIHDSSFYKWSLADFYSSEKPDAYGAFGRKIALPGLQVRRRGGFTRWTGGVVCGPRYVDKTEIKRKDGSVINVYEEVNDPLRRRSIGSNYKKEYVILRHKFRRQGESYR